MKKNQIHSRWSPLKKDDFGHYLVLILEQKGYNLSWLINNPQRDQIIQHIENAFERQMAYSQGFHHQPSQNGLKNQEKRALC